MYDQLIIQTFLDIEWRVQAKEVWFRHAWEDVPLIVKTTSPIGSNAEIFFEVANTAYDSFARVVVRLSSTPIFYIRWCYYDTPLRNLPDAPDNVRIWRFIKNGFEGISIECNGVVVANVRFGDARSECSASRWTDTEVNFLKFNPDWDRTVAVGTVIGTFHNFQRTIINVHDIYSLKPLESKWK